MNKKNISKIMGACLLSCGLAAALTGCKNGNADFPDFEGGTTAYFAYQYPVRTIVLGDDDYDTSLDKAHQCMIKSTFGGSYNASNGTVQVAVDPTLVNGLTFEDGTPVKAMPLMRDTISLAAVKEPRFLSSTRLISQSVFWDRIML